MTNKYDTYIYTYDTHDTYDTYNKYKYIKYIQHTFTRTIDKRHIVHKDNTYNSYI